MYVSAEMVAGGPTAVTDFAVNGRLTEVVPFSTDTLVLEKVTVGEGLGVSKLIAVPDVTVHDELASLNALTYTGPRFELIELVVNVMADPVPT